MSLGVKKKVADHGGPGGASHRPASAIWRFSSDLSGSDKTWSLGGSIDVLHAGGEFPLAGARGLEKSDTVRTGKVVKGRPSSALALASERKRKEEEGGYGADETQEDPLQTLDNNIDSWSAAHQHIDSCQATIYMLMRRTPDSMSRAFLVAVLLPFLALLATDWHTCSGALLLHPCVSNLIGCSFSKFFF